MRTEFNPLFRTPKHKIRPKQGSGGDGTYLHKDDIWATTVKSLVPHVIYADNFEIIDAFAATVVNYSPISINIMDFWNKINLQQAVIPNPNDTHILQHLYDKDKRKVYIEHGKAKAFWVNSMMNLQERVAYSYLNNLYTSATRTKMSHTVRQKIYRMFELWDYKPDDTKELLFSRINKLFKEERFVTNKDYNMRKGKKIDLEYAARSAWDSMIEGPLTSPSFFLDYIPVLDTLQNEVALEYKVESVLLPFIYDSFVMPLAHPIGMFVDYLKVCKIELSDHVLGGFNWRADVISVKCTYPSSVTPFLPPPMKTEWKENPSYNPGIAVSDNNLKYIYDLPFPAQVPNTEIIINDGSLDGPFDPGGNHLPHIVLATADGKSDPTPNGIKLWYEIIDFDEDEGNILIDIEKGTGSYEYMGYDYTKWLFENGAYVIDYACVLPNGKYEHIIEYYRYDIFDTSIDYNVIATNALRPAYAYPGIKYTSLVNGLLNNFNPCVPPGASKWGPFPFGFVNPYNPPPMPPLGWEDLKIKGYDLGYYTPTPAGWRPWMSGLTTYGFWDKNTNIINTDKQFTPVHALIGRWIQTRECVVQAFNLRKEPIPSIDEDFSFSTICYLDNIYNPDLDKVMRNIVWPSPWFKEETNITTRYHKPERYEQDDCV